jgi:hypothetical protein
MPHSIGCEPDAELHTAVGCDVEAAETQQKAHEKWAHQLTL